MSINPIGTLTYPCYNRKFWIIYWSIGAFPEPPTLEKISIPMHAQTSRDGYTAHGSG